VTKLNIESLADVRVTVTAMLGRTTAPIGEVLAYAPGTVVSLDVSSDAPVPLLVNGVVVATGDLVTMEDGALAILIQEILSEGARSTQ
jgi:flagellar motor switch protein FliN